MIKISNKVVMTMAVARYPYHDHRPDRNRVANHIPDCCPDCNRTEENGSDYDIGIRIEIKKTC